MTSVTLRGYRDSDLPALVALVNASDRVDKAGFATTATTLAHSLATPGSSPAEDVLLAEQGGQLVGYVRLVARSSEDGDRVIVLGIVHPAWRRRGVGTALMRRAEERAAGFKTGKLLFFEMPARSPVAGAAELAMSRGMRPVRYFSYMECEDLQRQEAPVLPVGMWIRPYVVGQDEATFVPAYNAGFSDHWGYSPHSLDKELHRVSDPTFRAEDNLVAVDQDGRITGLCILVFPQTEGNLPMVDDLAVVPSYRRRGIGRALLLAGLRRIREEGYSTAGIAVDSEHPNKAFRLYESVGFAPKAQSAVYRKELA